MTGERKPRQVYEREGAVLDAVALITAAREQQETIKRAEDVAVGEVVRLTHESWLGVLRAATPVKRQREGRDTPVDDHVVEVTTLLFDTEAGEDVPVTSSFFLSEITKTRR